MGAEDSKEARSDLRIAPEPDHKYFLELDDEERQKVEYMLRLCEARPSDGWKINSSVESVGVMSAYPEKEDGTKSQVCMIRGEISDQVIEPQFMLGQITSPDVGAAVDPMCIEQRVIHQYDATRFILHGMFKLPPPLKARDFIFKAISFQINTRQIITIGYSIGEDHEYYVKPSQKYVRGEIGIAGYLFTANEDLTRTTFTYMIQVDVAGWIPKWITNLVSSDQATNVARVRDALEKFQKAFKKHKDGCIEIKAPYCFQFYRIFGMFLPLGDNVYQQVSCAEDDATILWYNTEDSRWLFSHPSQYKQRSKECFAYCETKETKLPFEPHNEEGEDKIQWLVKNKSGEFEPLESLPIDSGKEFIERLGIDKMEFKEKKGWFKRKFGSKSTESEV